MVTLASIGRSAGHIEGPDKVTGHAHYAGDIALASVLWGKCLRSPHPHARIVSIDTSRAKRLPGVYAVLTAADVPDRLIGHRILDVPVLAKDRVRFIGEKVAAVAADSDDVAEHALQLIEVVYEELPAVFDAADALNDDAPRIHADPAAYSTAKLIEGSPAPNLSSQVFYRHGDVEAGFAQADRIFERTYEVASVHQGYIEPHACAVEVEAGGKVNVWLSNKAPFRTRNEIAEAIGVPPEQVRINQVAIGGDFGGKGSVMDAVVAYHLAARTGRAVKMIMNYTEELTAGNPRHPTTISLRTGVTNDGHLTAQQAKIIFNCGAYAGFKPGTTIHGAIDAGGPYRLPNLDVEALCVYTNTVPHGHMRAPGAPQVVFALESHMDVIAHDLGLDPVEFRLRNVLGEGDTSPLGHHYKDVHSRETLLAAAEAAGWSRPKAANVGLGLSFYDRTPGSGASSAVVSIDAGAEITLLTAIADTGTGSLTVLQQVVAEELQAPLETVHVVTGDTDTASFDGGVGGSRVTHAAGQATLAASRELRQALVQLAAQVMGNELEQVELRNGRFVSPDGPGLSLRDLMSRAAELEEVPIRRSGSYTPSGSSNVTSFCAQIAEVEVDLETGRVKLRRFTTAHDVGTIINPLTHQGQIEGGMAMGMGQALIELLETDDGAVTTPNLGDYKLPNIADVPELITVLLEAPAGPAPYEGKSIGETSNCPVAAAVANAVFDATGIRIAELPITSEKVYNALQQRVGTGL